MMKRQVYILILSLMIVSSAMAQDDRKLVREGNKLYRTNKYTQAENTYRKALAQNSANPQATYDLGCALMAQGNDSAAIVQFANAAKMEHNKLRRAKAYHNIGVVNQKKQNYGEAIEAYKNALRNNPNDNDTRYNLALCKRQQQQKNQENNDKNKKDKNKKDNNQDKKNNNQDKKDRDNKDKNKDRDKQQQQPKSNMDRQNAEQLLNAAMQEEKATHDRLKKAMQQPSRRRTDKNW